MIDFVPLDLFYPIYINTCLFLVVFTIIHLLTIDLNSDKNVVFINIVGYLLLISLIIFLGFRPISSAFGDTVNYNKSFQNYANGALIGDVNDLGWHKFMKFFASFTSVHVFLAFCFFLYLFPLYKISKNLLKDYWWYPFIMFVVSFSFWSYGVNGVRNGVACSLFLLGVSYRNKIPIMIVLFLIAFNFHKTLALPIFAYGLTHLYNDSKFYLKAWLACIPVSLVLGSLFITLFTTLGFGDDGRLSGYLSGTGSGFRWDFVFHSGFAVASGYYFIVKKGFQDKIYSQLLNTYLICNSFWILVIRANFSNRFAYLSWFMMAIVVIYPFFKTNYFKDKQLVISKVIFAYFMFTYLMSYVYYAIRASQNATPT